MIDPKLAGKIAVVTGANYGIGAAVARAFAAQGAAVFIHFFRETPAAPVEEPREPGDALYAALKARTADELLASIRDAGGRAEAWEADFTAAGSIPELFDRAEAAFGPVEILVNNAAHCTFDTFLPQTAPVFGGVSPQQAEPVSAESHDRHFAVNSRTPALLMAEFARRHAARGAQWGRIVNISTDAAASHPGAVSYGASKHALESFSRAAAWELARYGITVNVIAPGPVQSGWISPEFEKQLIPAIPLGRIGRPEDIADAAVFFASEQARWITGQLLYVGGGQVMPQ